MSYRSEFNMNMNPFNVIIGLLVLIVFFLGFFYISKILYQVLLFLAPVLLILALVLDYKTVLGYGRWLIRLLKRNTVTGIVAILLSIIGFPIVSAFLLGRILIKRRFKQAKENYDKQKNGEFIDFEELETRQLPEEKLKEKRGNYDQLFD